MTTRGQWFAQGACLLCGQLFAFDPERVCSHPWPPPDGPLQPICRPCITEVVNPNGDAAGCPSTRSCPAPTPTSLDHHALEDLMKLRLHGTPAECVAATARLRSTPGLHITDQSRPYPDRGGELVRVYVTVDLDPTSGDQPSQQGRPRGGRQR